MNLGNNIHITGWGAVSPAGWSAGTLHEAVVAGVELPITTQRRVADSPERRFRSVPPMSAPPDWMKGTRMRRTTSAAKFAVHAAAEALGTEKLALVQSGAVRIGTVFCTMNGCVQFSRRFFAEALENPALASPILFPETVFNAPASHVAALLKSPEINYTLVGDSAQFVRGIEFASQWLEDGIVDACLVVAAEELDWVVDEAWMLFGKRNVAAEGAAAVLLERAPLPNQPAIALKHLTPARTYSNRLPREEAARQTANDLRSNADAQAILIDGLGSSVRADVPESQAWAAWEGEHVSPRRVLGEGFAVSSGWQTIVACEWLRAGKTTQTIISAVGISEQAAGLVLGTKDQGVMASSRH